MNLRRSPPNGQSLAKLNDKARPVPARRWRARVLLVLFGLVMGLAAAEVVLRIRGYSGPNFYRVDPLVGYAFRPNVEGWNWRENKNYVRINSDGLRDREHAKAKPANTFRIALLGDSYCAAMQVPMEKTFWYQMEQQLKTCPTMAGRQVELINFGVSGYGTVQELLTFRHKARAYQPDLIVLAVTTNNDPSNNVRELRRDDRSPYFKLQQGQLVLDQSFLSSRRFRIQQSLPVRAWNLIEDHSRVVQAINAARIVFRERRELRAAQQTGAAQPSPTSTATSPPARVEGDEIGVENVVYAEPRSAIWDEAWNVTEALIRQMRNEVQAAGAQFVVVTLSNPIQVHPNPNARGAFMRHVGATDMFYPDKRIENFCRREQIPVIVLAPELQAYAEQHQVFLHGFGEQIGNGHWNELGNQVAAGLLTPKVCEFTDR